MKAKDFYITSLEKTMRYAFTFICLLACLGFVAAAEEVTLDGKVCCAKCELGKEKTCATVVVVSEKGKDEHNGDDNIGEVILDEIHVAKPVARQGHAQHPKDCSGNVVDGKLAVEHVADAGYEWPESAYDGNEAAQHNSDAAPAFIKVLCIQ